MTSASISDSRSSLRTKAKPTNSDTRIYGDLEGLHEIGDMETMPSHSARRTRRSSNGTDHERSLSQLDTSGRSQSSLRTKSKMGKRRRRSTSALATSTAGSFVMTMGKSASEPISSPAETFKKTMRRRGSSEKRMSMSASELITSSAGSSEKTKSSSGSFEKKMRRASSDFITGAARPHGKELRTSASEIITNTAGSSQKKKKSSSGLSEKKMSRPSSDVVTSSAGSSEKKISQAESEIIASKAASSEKKMTRAASEIITFTDGAFDKTMSRSTSNIFPRKAGSSERTKSSSAEFETKKSKSASEKVKSRSESSEKKKKKKSKSIDPLNPIAKRDGLDSAHKDKKMGSKPIIESGEEPREAVTLTAKEKSDEITIMIAEDAGAWFFENASWFKDEVATEPSLNAFESRRQKNQVVDISKVTTLQHRKARNNTISQVSIDFLIPKLTDTPMSGISTDSLDWEKELYKKSCLDLGACAPTNDGHKLPLMTVRAEGMESLVTPLSDGTIGDIATGGIPKPYDITAKTDVKIKQDLDAFGELDRKLTSLLSLETRRRLRRNKPLPDLDVLIISQGGDTPMSGLSMDGSELLEGHVKECFLNLGASTAPFDVDDNSFAIDLDEAPELRFAGEEKRQPSLRCSASCEEGMSISNQNETLRRRRTLRRSETCKETVGSKLAETTLTDAKECESPEISIRDFAGNKVGLRKTATAQRGGRSPSSQCLDETRHSRQSYNRQRSKTRHKEKSSKSVQYYFDLHIPARCDPPLSGISMRDLEWVEDLYATLDVHS